MKPAPFAYDRAHDLAHALELLREFGDDAKILAGGQSLVPLLALRLASPVRLVDIAMVSELRRTTFDTGRVSIGAAVTQRVAEFDLAVEQRVPLLSAALPHIAHPQIRNRGTVCGSLAHGDPAAELPTVALALDAVFHAQSVRGLRRIDANDFFRSYLETALEPDELLVCVEFPEAPPRTGAAFCEVARRHGDFAVAGVGAQIALHPDGRIADARLALTGVASIPVRARRAEHALRDAVPSEVLFGDVAQMTASELHPPDDIHATGAYRTHVTAVLIRRALQGATNDALRGADQ